MKITIVGAAGSEVTGSAYYVQTNTASILVDCGLCQGGKKAEALNRPPALWRLKRSASTPLIANFSMTRQQNFSPKDRFATT